MKNRRPRQVARKPIGAGRSMPAAPREADVWPAPPVTPMLRWHWSLIAGLTLFHFFTFVGKPPHIDDTLYLETARGILQDPLRPLCNTVNWEMIPRPIYKFAVNPPLYNYQQALVIKLFGWNIAALHVLAAGYVLLAAVSVFYLARRFTPWPVATLLLFMLSPTFLPQTNLMLDVPGMALVAATVAAWVRGVDGRSNRWLALGAALATLAVWTKYNSAVVLPLMALYALLWGRWLALPWIALPVVGLWAWGQWNIAIFPEKKTHLDIARSRFERATRNFYQQSMLSLMSWGGAFFFMPAWAAWTWVRRRWILSAAIAAPLFLLFLVEFVLAYGPLTRSDGFFYSAAVSLTQSLGFGHLPSFAEWKMPHWPEQLFFVGNALAMAAWILVTAFARWDSLRERWRDGTIRDDLFLLAWPFGMSLFNGMFAPHHAPRYYFVAYPAVPLLLMRGIQAALARRAGGAAEAGDAGRSETSAPRFNQPASIRIFAPSRATRGLLWGSIALQAVVGLILVGSDNTFAQASQDFVARLAAHPRVQGNRLDYVGHWGFQYHAQQQPNFHVIDIRQPPPPVGGLVAVVMDTGWGEFPHWLKSGRSGTEQFTTTGVYRYKDAQGTQRAQSLRFKILEDWDVPHPWPLQTVELTKKLLIYSPRFYHNRLPYGRGTDRSHRMVLVEREL